MKNSKIIIICVVILIAFVAFLWWLGKTKSETADIETPARDEQVVSNVIGCYIATLSQDVYTLNILSVEGENVSGTLSFKNFQKDSSSGTFVGTYKDDILRGIYSFDSEGMHSDLEVIFKKTEEGFIRGYGDMNTTGDRFADINNITYDTSLVFTESPCATNT